LFLATLKIWRLVEKLKSGKSPVKALSLAAKRIKRVLSVTTRDSRELRSIIKVARLDEEKLTGPTNWLCERWIVASTGWEARDEGMFPVKLFESRARFFKAGKERNLSGKGPERVFEERFLHRHGEWGGKAYLTSRRDSQAFKIGERKDGVGKRTRKTVARKVQGRNASTFASHP
jgi:hypothetical protein